MLDKLAEELKSRPIPSISRDGIMYFLYMALLVRIVRTGYFYKISYLRWKNRRLSKKYPWITDEMVRDYISQGGLE